ncbi:hypothetical protein [Parasitella parasitica]|uniref:Tc1-like transposase DDE domain-containing protein n=1 Tax=Parasitella parasitica TaxID=35722 RepID=A0A0B7NCG6_9FUNG|nr:hypothetical protein [Parasitella parasitica]
MSQARNNNSLSKQNNNRDGTQRVTKRGLYKKSSQEIRNFAIAYCYKDDNMLVTEAAKKFGDKISTLSTQLTLYINEGRNGSEKRGRKRGEVVKFTDKHEEFIVDSLDMDCTQTLGMLREKLLDNFPELQEKGVSISGLWRLIVERIGFTLTCTKPVEKRRNCPDTINSRKEYINKLLEKGITYKTNCIFVDEAGFNANLIRRTLNVSILAVISYHGIFGVSVKKIKGETTGVISKEFVRGIIKKLDETNTGPHFFVMDNATIHRAPVVKELFKNSQHQMCLLPPYSPFLNPIEECFSKLKTLV